MHEINFFFCSLYLFRENINPERSLFLSESRTHSHGAEVVIRKQSQLDGIPLQYPLHMNRAEKKGFLFHCIADGMMRKCIWHRRVSMRTTM